MPAKIPTYTILFTLLAVILAACASRNDVPVAALSGDDDAFCRANNVQVGSPEYVACRKDRDAQRSAALGRADRSQRDLGEYMLNHPDHP
jgi:D-aminopeptidase